ncbi:unnamed protein product [Leptosia nina]|uniref:Uncharacterized protein n=1 Tax=Leptosia nina TaxID=320188 RepID=A0AAV1JAA9_9NEOP
MSFVVRLRRSDLTSTLSLARSLHVRALATLPVLADFSAIFVDVKRFAFGRHVSRGPVNSDKHKVRLIVGAVHDIDESDNDPDTVVHNKWLSEPEAQSQRSGANLLFSRRFIVIRYEGFIACGVKVRSAIYTRAPRGRTLESNGRDSTSTNGRPDKWSTDDPVSHEIQVRKAFKPIWDLSSGLRGPLAYTIRVIYAFQSTIAFDSYLMDVTGVIALVKYERFFGEQSKDGAIKRSDVNLSGSQAIRLLMKKSAPPGCFIVDLCN